MNEYKVDTKEVGLEEKSSLLAQFRTDLVLPLLFITCPFFPFPWLGLLVVFHGPHHPDPI